jgi:hypothetical protein
MRCHPEQSQGSWFLPVSSVSPWAGAEIALYTRDDKPILIPLYL